MRLLHRARAFLVGLLLGAVPGYLHGSETVDIMSLVAGSPLGRFLSGGVTTVQTLIVTYGIWAFLTASFLKGMLLFPIVPESVTPLYVLHAADSVFDVVLISIAAAATITAGNFIVYLLSRLVGERFFDSRSIPFGRTLEVLATNHGRTIMLVSRLIPFIGAWATVPAGIVRLRVRIFLVYTFIGFLLYEGFFAFLAWYGIHHGMLSDVAFLQALVPAG